MLKFEKIEGLINLRENPIGTMLKWFFTILLSLVKKDNLGSVMQKFSFFFSSLAMRVLVPELDMSDEEIREKQLKKLRSHIDSCTECQQLIHEIEKESAVFEAERGLLHIKGELHPKEKEEILREEFDMGFDEDVIADIKMNVCLILFFMAHCANTEEEIQDYLDMMEDILDASELEFMLKYLP